MVTHGRLPKVGRAKPAYARSARANDGIEGGDPAAQIPPPSCFVSLYGTQVRTASPVKGSDPSVPPTWVDLLNARRPPEEGGAGQVAGAAPVRRPGRRRSGRRGLFGLGCFGGLAVGCLRCGALGGLRG